MDFAPKLVIVIFVIFNIPMAPAGPLYQRVLQKEAAYADCGKAMEKETKAYLSKKLSPMNRCQDAKECIWVVDAEMVASEKAFLKYNHCYLRLQKPSQFCMDVFDDEPLTCVNDRDLPCYRDPPEKKAPTHFTCVKNKCVAQFDGKPRNWNGIRYQLYQKNSKEDSVCARDLREFYTQMKTKYIPKKGTEK